MESLLQQILSFLLQMLTLVVQFFIAMLNLILQFAQNIVGIAR
jgi:hypothetical protein